LKTGYFESVDWRTVLNAVAFAFFLVFAAAIASGPTTGDLQWAGIHHGYAGVLLILASQAGLAGRSGLRPRIRGLAWLAALLGLALLADDAFQHAVQRWAGLPGYRSPLHNLHGPLIWRHAWSRELYRRIDRLLGAP
jgi:hypothetical protein